jgi:hypothetical protein
MAILPPDEISTIFLVGFPADFKERELQNLFTFAAGFEGASLKHPEPPSSSAVAVPLEGDEELWHGFRLSAGSPGTQSAGIKQQTIGFARFQRRQDAIAARDHLNGRCIDTERGILLKVEMAKKNLFIAPRKHSASLPASGSPSSAASAQESPCLSPPFSLTTVDLGEFGELVPPFHKTGRSLSLSIPGNPEPIDIHVPSSTIPLKPASTAATSAAPKPSTSTLSPKTFSLNSGASPGALYVLGENPPCNTLYVGNLPLNADEEELRALFSCCAGYKRLSFKVKANGPMCFVEFEDIACATNAMDRLYGTLLSTSTKGGIRLSYSKNPLGVRPGSVNTTNMAGYSIPAAFNCRNAMLSAPIIDDDEERAIGQHTFAMPPGHRSSLQGSSLKAGQPDSFAAFRSLTMTPFSPF